jgi:hypothetical protein
MFNAAIKELRYEGGRAAKANIVLCFVLAAVFLSICLPSVLSELRNFFGTVPEQSTGRDIVFALLLFLFFVISIYFVYSLELYKKKING